MPYLIDGHNLIPKIPGFSLQAMDDEMQLVNLLQEFCRRSRKEVIVYFDNAPPGQPRARTFGTVIAHFVRQGMTADEAIRAKLQRLGPAARNWTVVSSDAAVQVAARAARARSLSSEQFAALLSETLNEAAKDPGERDEASLSPDDVDDWMKLFGEEDSDR